MKDVVIMPKEIRERVDEAIKFINRFYGKQMVFDNNDGSFYNRLVGLDVSPQSIIFWEESLKK